MERRKVTGTTLKVVAAIVIAVTPSITAYFQAKNHANDKAAQAVEVGNKVDSELVAAVKHLKSEIAMLKFQMLMQVQHHDTPAAVLDEIAELFAEELAALDDDSDGFDEPELLLPSAPPPNERRPRAPARVVLGGEHREIVNKAQKVADQRKRAKAPSWLDGDEDFQYPNAQQMKE